MIVLSHALARNQTRWAQQYEINLPGDESAEPQFASCAECGGYDDLHLTAWKSKRAATAKILCADCRSKWPERFTLSVLLSLVMLPALAQLKAQGEWPAGHAVVASLRQWLAKDLSAEWEKFRQLRQQRQAGLDLGFEGELKLG